MTHGEEEAQTKEKSRPRHISGCTFFNFYILGEGGEIEGNNMRKIMKELCPTQHMEKKKHEHKMRPRKELCPPSQHIDKTFFCFLMF